MVIICQQLQPAQLFEINQQSQGAHPMLGQRRRQWANVSPTLGLRLVFAGQCHLNPYTAKRFYYSRFNPFYMPFKSQLLGTKSVIKYQYLQIFELTLNRYEHF